MPVFLRQLAKSIDPWTANGIRYPFSAVLFWPALVYAYRRGLIDRRLILSCAIPSFLAFGGQVFWAQAPYYLPASSIGFFIRLAMVWALLGAMVMFPEERRLLKSGWFWIGLLISFAACIVLANERGVFDASASSTGVIVIWACSLFFGLYGVSVKACFGNRPHWLTFGLVAQFVSVGTLVGMWFKGQPSDLAKLDSTGWLLMFVSSVTGIALGHLLLYNAVRLLGATLSSALQTVTPLLTFSLAWIFLGEQMSYVECLAGGVLIVGAIFLVKSQSGRPMDVPDIKAKSEQSAA
jgi:drug/metabolite transporter (DMT)-like permease